MKTKRKTRRKATAPKAVELRIRILQMHPEPLDDGNMQFYCAFPRTGSPDVQIMAKTAKRAKEVLEDFLYNALDGNEDLEDWE